MLTAGKGLLFEGEWAWGRQNPQSGPCRGEVNGELLLPCSSLSQEQPSCQGNFPQAPDTASRALGSQGINARAGSGPCTVALFQLCPLHCILGRRMNVVFHAGNHPASVETTQLPSPSHFWGLKQEVRLLWQHADLYK